MTVGIKPKPKTSEQSSDATWLSGRMLAIAGILAVVVLACSTVFWPDSAWKKLVFGPPKSDSENQPMGLAGPDLAAASSHPGEQGDGEDGETDRLVSQLNASETPAVADAEGSASGQVSQPVGNETPPAGGDSPVAQPFDSAMTAQQIVEANQMDIRELQESSRVTDRRMLSLMDRLDEISLEMGKLRLDIADLKQFDRGQNGRLRELEKIQGRWGEVAAEFEKFVDSELPDLRRAVGTRTETQATLPNETASAIADDETGTLVLDNQTERTIEIFVNGKRELLKPGRNSFEVQQTEVRVEGDGRSWLLDAGLWQTYQGRKVMYRDKWPL